MNPIPFLSSSNTLPSILVNVNTTYDTSDYDTTSALAKRIEICKSCPELNSLNFCKQCGCYMPLKVRIKSSECPLKKWNRLEITIPETKDDLKNLELNDLKNKMNSDNVSTTDKEIYNEIFKRINAGQ